MALKRVLIIANKDWEANALMQVLLEPKACPDNLPWPGKLGHPLPPQGDSKRPKPRAVYQFHEAYAYIEETREVRVEVWCLQDAMSPAVSSSSTKEKDEVLSVILYGRKSDIEVAKDPDFVVAFGTAAFPGETSYNGCVFVGANTFIHNPYRNDEPRNESHWYGEGSGRLIKASTKSAELFNPIHGVFDESLKSQIESRFIPPPMNPARKQIVAAAANYTAVGVVNITNYDDYAWGDEEALRAFEDACKSRRERPPVGSVETTHGIIRQVSDLCDAPFIFISGITDRIGHFNMEVAPRVYAQNFVCAHNAGVVTAWLMPRMVSYLRKKDR
jgi:hypothetical protein